MNMDVRLADEKNGRTLCNMVVVVVFEFSNVVGQGLDPCSPVCYGLLRGRLWEGQLPGADAGDIDHRGTVIEHQTLSSLTQC